MRARWECGRRRYNRRGTLLFSVPSRTMVSPSVVFSFPKMGKEAIQKKMCVWPCHAEESLEKNSLIFEAAAPFNDLSVPLRLSSAR